MERSKGKPDLMAVGGAAGGGHRILAHLEHGAGAAVSPGRPASAWAVDGWMVGLGVLLLAVFGLVWLMHDTGAASAPAGAAPAVMERPAPAYAAQAPAPPPLAPPESAPAPPTAAIIDEPEPAALARGMPGEGRPAARPAPQRASQPTSRAGPQQTSQPGPQLTSQSGARLAPRPVPQPVLAAVPAEAARPVAGRAAAQGAARAMPASPAPSGKGVGAVPARSAAGTRGDRPADADADVTLLAALVAHASQPATVAPEPSRDVVERTDGDSTAALLARCRQLGPIESMLCRSRICAGRWDSEPACGAPAR